MKPYVFFIRELILKILQLIKNYSNNFYKNTIGAIIIEFAIVAPIFIPVVFALYDVGMMLTIRAELQYVADLAARYGKTGAVQNMQSGNPAGQESTLKSYISGLVVIAKPGNLSTSIQSFSSFQAMIGNILGSPPTMGSGCANPNTAGGSYTPCAYTAPSSQIYTYLVSGSVGPGSQGEMGLYTLTYTYNPIVSFIFGSSRTLRIYSVTQNNRVF